jgi:hypothetical protein
MPSAAGQNKKPSAVAQNKDFLRVLMKHKKKPLHVKRLIELADPGEIDACCEIYLNILKGNVYITPQIADFLSKHKKKCEALASRKFSTEAKRKILKNQKGGIFPFLPLLAPLLGPVISAVTGAITGQ